MTSLASLALVLLAAEPATPEMNAAVVGRWSKGDVLLVLSEGGTGTVTGLDVPSEQLRWRRERTGRVLLDIGDDSITCLTSARADSMLCRGDGGPWPHLKKEGWTEPPPVRVELAPCTIRVLEGESAGPVRLGMSVKALEKLGLGLVRGVPTREWMSGGPYKVRLGAKDEAVSVRADAQVPGQVCLGPWKGPAPFPDLRTGGTFIQSPRGLRAVHDDRAGSLAWAEAFTPPATTAAAPDACTVPVIPGVSAGPVRLGMTKDQATRLGLGLEPMPGRSTLSGDAYSIELDAAGKVAAIAVFLSNGATPPPRACLDSQPLSASWHVGELCARGFCSCTVTRGTFATGVAIATCPEGLVLRFDVAAPGGLFAFEVRPRSPTVSP
jgi:hypothetical protein